MAHTFVVRAFFFLCRFRTTPNSTDTYLPVVPSFFIVPAVGDERGTRFVFFLPLLQGTAVRLDGSIMLPLGPCEACEL